MATHYKIGCPIFEQINGEVSRWPNFLISYFLVSVTSAGRDLLEQTQQKLTGTSSSTVAGVKLSTTSMKIKPPEKISAKAQDLDMLGDDEYESLPASAGLTTYMAAGAAAGILEHCFMYPLDSIKTRMQSVLPQENCRYKGVADAFRTISKSEGMFRTVRGINVVAMGAGPAHALYFSCYETMKKSFSSKLHSKTGQSHIANG